MTGLYYIVYFLRYSADIGNSWKQKDNSNGAQNGAQEGDDGSNSFLYSVCDICYKFESF